MTKAEKIIRKLSQLYDLARSIARSNPDHPWNKKIKAIQQPKR